MKHKTLLISLLFVTYLINAQNKKNDFGLKAGLNYSSFSDNSSEDFGFDYTSKVGFYIGGYINFRITEKISIQPELLFSQQGSDFSISLLTINGTNSKREGEIKESLVLIPVMLNVSINDKFEILTGPQFGYILERSKDPDLIAKEGPNSDKFEIGANIEVGYNFGKKYRIGFRYTYGITKRQNLRSSVMQFGLQYKL